jgi:hypothetical protein
MHKEKRSTQKLSSDNLRRSSNLEDLNIDKQGDNAADDSVCISYEVYNIWTGFIFLWTKRNSKASVEYWIPYNCIICRLAEQQSAIEEDPVRWSLMEEKWLNMRTE